MAAIWIEQTVGKRAWSACAIKRLRASKRCLGSFDAFLHDE
jgi:hypothetical protein